MKLVPESLNEVNFERGAKTPEEIRDKIFGKILSVELDAMNCLVKENPDGSLSFDMSDDDTEYFIKEGTSKGAKIEPLIKNTPYGVMVKMTGTKEQLIPALVMFDPNSRSEEELAKALEPWDGSDEDLWGYMDPDY
jgi:hypothetical protein